MQIVHLVSSGQLGGTEASVIEMATSVVAAQPSWRIRVTTPEHGAFEQKLEDAGVPVDVRPFPKRFARIGETGRTGGRCPAASWHACWPRFPGLRVTAGRCAPRSPRDGLGQRADIVHAHGFKMQVLGALSMPARARLVWHLHDYVSGRLVSAPLLRRLAPRVSLMIANSDSVAADVRRVCGTRVPIVTIYNGVNITTFAPGGHRLDLDACSGLPPAAPGTLRIGLVGTFGLWKGHTTFLAAIAKLGAARPVRAYVIGGAQYQTIGSQHSEATLRAEASRLGIVDRVAFTGPVRDPAAAMRVARHRRARQHAARAVRNGDCRGDGLWPPGRGQPCGRRGGARRRRRSTA